MSEITPSPRIFTVVEVNDLLSSLRPLMARIFAGLELLKSRSEVIIRQRGLSPDSRDLVEKLKNDDSVARAIQEVQELVEEINQFGCVCKGVEEGLIDFPCLLSEEVVFLCWRYGEESVGYWHRIEDGFAGRRPLLDIGEKGGTSYH